MHIGYRDAPIWLFQSWCWYLDFRYRPLLTNDAIPVLYQFESVSDRYLTVWDRWIPNIEPCIYILVTLRCLLQYLIYHLIFLSNNQQKLATKILIIVISWKNTVKWVTWLFIFQCVFSCYVPILSEVMGTPNPIIYFPWLLSMERNWRNGRLWCKRDTAVVSTSMHSSFSHQVYSLIPAGVTDASGIWWNILLQL